MRKLSCLMLLANFYSAQLSQATKDIFQVKLGDLETLIETGQLETLSQVLGNDGALAVTEFPEVYTQSVINLQSVAPKCLQQSQYPKFDLPDGSSRRTFGLESGDGVVYPGCLRTESLTIHSHYNILDSLLSRLIMRVAGSGGDTDWSSSKLNTRGEFSTQLYKEHIHVYTKSLSSTNKASASKYAAPFHIDKGLLLLLTPFKQHPLLVKTKDGALLRTEDLDESAVIVIIGSALPDWLLKGSQSSKSFYASPHAVPSLAGSLQSRSVFARMKVAPDDAVPSSHSQTFADFFFGQSSHSTEDLCPINNLPKQLVVEKSWAGLKSSECSHSRAYCWMNCLDLPSSCQAGQPAECLNSAETQCCTDSITENCANMDQTCGWQCATNTTTNTQHHHQPSKVHTEEKFCNGYGTDMFMQGFTASGNSRDSCVILLFRSWILDTRTKFVMGCIGVILLGIGIEAMLCFRRKLQKRIIMIRISGGARRAAIIFLFGVNIASGYFAMLVAMTYSVELFICMILGLVIGHGIFNTGAAVGESVDPCCASQAATNDAKHEEATKM